MSAPLSASERSDLRRRAERLEKAAEEWEVCSAHPPEISRRELVALLGAQSDLLAALTRAVLS